MGMIFPLIFLMLCVGAAGWLLFIWAVKSGQYEDVEGPKYRMMDDDEGLGSVKGGKPRQADGKPGREGGPGSE